MTRYKKIFDSKRSTNKMPSAMPFVFNAVELFVATINGKSRTCAKKVCRALEYNKKTADIVKAFVAEKIILIRVS